MSRGIYLIENDALLIMFTALEVEIIIDNYNNKSQTNQLLSIVTIDGGN